MTVPAKTPDRRKPSYKTTVTRLGIFLREAAQRADGAGLPDFVEPEF
jgi:hypothetical protein